MRVPPCCVCSLSCCVRVRCAWCASRRPRARVVLLTAVRCTRRERESPERTQSQSQSSELSIHSSLFYDTQLSCVCGLWPPTRDCATFALGTRDSRVRESAEIHARPRVARACACPLLSAHKASRVPAPRAHISGPTVVSSQPPTLLSLVLVNTKPFAHDSRADHTPTSRT